MRKPSRKVSTAAVSEGDRVTILLEANGARLTGISCGRELL